MLDFVSWLCLNNITMDKWAPAVAGAFFVYCRIGRASALQGAFLFAYTGLSFGAPVFLCQFRAGAARRPAVFFTEEILCMI